MKKFQEKEETVKKKVLVELTCDLCGKITGNNKGFNHSLFNEWDNEIYGVNRTEISWERGEQYPEGGSTKTTLFDICPDCFKNKLIPWFENQGAKKTIKNSYDV